MEPKGRRWDETKAPVVGRVAEKEDRLPAQGKACLQARADQRGTRPLTLCCRRYRQGRQSRKRRRPG